MWSDAVKPFRPLDAIFVTIFAAMMGLTAGCHIHLAESHKHFYGADTAKAEQMEAGQPDELERKYNESQKALGLPGKP